MATSDARTEVDLDVAQVLRAAAVDRRRRVRWARQALDVTTSVHDVLAGAAAEGAVVRVRAVGAGWRSGHVVHLGRDVVGLCPFTDPVTGPTTASTAAPSGACSLVAIGRAVVVEVARPGGATAAALSDSGVPGADVAGADARSRSFADLATELATGRRAHVVTVDGWEATVLVRAVGSAALVGRRGPRELIIAMATIAVLDLDVEREEVGQSSWDRSALPTTSG